MGRKGKAIHWGEEGKNKGQKAPEGPPLVTPGGCQKTQDKPTKEENVEDGSAPPSVIVRDFWCHRIGLLLPVAAAPSSPHAGGSGVGVLGPNVLYFWSIAARIAWSGLPSACMAITARVMLRQMSQ